MTPRSQFTLNIGGRGVRLGEHTLIMGVVNVTPDSFSDGGLYLDPKRAIRHGIEMARQGADWIDVGGESSRPGAKQVSPEEELYRVLPVVRGLRKRMRSLPISIDTTKAEVAEEAVRAGATIVNDISGLRFDPRIADVARRHGIPVVLMHIRGRPATMQHRPFARSIWRSIGGGLAWSIRQALSRGVRRSRLIIDPGLGFGKTRRQNFEIIAQLRRLRRFGLPVLVGASRKSFVQAVVAGEGLEPRNHVTPPLRTAHAGSARGGATTAAEIWPLLEGASGKLGALPSLGIGDDAAVVASILGGAHIVRVHDVAAVMPAVRVADAILQAGYREKTGKEKSHARNRPRVV